jgi:MoaA/NifB/PqqE/SkfB family radical SAM enzyme
MRRSLTPNKPYHVQWLITRRCNYRCEGCNVWREQDDRELATEQILEGLDILRDLGTIEVVLSGGNPLLRDDIGEIIDYASRYFITTVYDNGSLALKRIEELRKADFVAISLDSLDPQKNDRARGIEGAYRNSMEAVAQLHKEGIPVSVSPTISQANLHEIVNFTEYFLKMNVPVWYCLYSYDLNDQSQLFRIGKRSDSLAIADVKAMGDLCDSLVGMKKRNKKILITGQVLKAVKKLYRTGERTWKCRALQNFFVVDHLGRVAGCHLHDPVTTIFDLPKIWNTEKLDRLRKVYRDCTQCTYMCYIFYSLHGSVRGNLRIAREQWKNAGLLLKRDDSSLPNWARQK